MLCLSRSRTYSFSNLNSTCPLANFHLLGILSSNNTTTSTATTALMTKWIKVKGSWGKKGGKKQFCNNIHCKNNIVASYPCFILFLFIKSSPTFVFSILALVPMFWCLNCWRMFEEPCKTPPVENPWSMTIWYRHVIFNLESLFCLLEK